MTEKYAQIDPFRYEPVAVECACPWSNCLLDCIHHLLTGTTDRSTRLQELLAEQQRMQITRYQSPFYPQFNYSTPVRVSFNAGYSSRIFTFWPKCCESTSASIDSSRVRRLNGVTSPSIRGFGPGRKPFICCTKFSLSRGKATLYSLPVFVRNVLR